MKNQTIRLTIEKLAGLGDGVGEYDGLKVFVPYTAAGDEVDALVVRETVDAVYTKLSNIIKYSPDRTKPICKHFYKCGGCSLQHLNDKVYTDFKQKMAQEAVRKADFSLEVVEPLVKMPVASRRRAELKVEKGKIGYYAEKTHKLVEIEECPVLEPELFALIKDLKDEVANDPEIKNIKINGVDNGYVTSLEPHKATITLGEIKVELPQGAFLQATRKAQELMTNLVVAATKNSKNILDLFAGIGAYSFPALANASVTAIEGETSMVEAMQNAAKKHNLKNFKAEQRDLFYKPILAEELATYDAIIINPPRAGAKLQCEQIAIAKPHKVVMVSCNPATFSRDARILKDAGYNLLKLTPIDQFVFSSHLELVAEFEQ